MKKSNTIIRILIGLILIALMIDIILIWKNKKEQKESLNISEVNNEEKVNEIKYFCSTKDVKNEKIKDIKYQSREEYSFAVLNGEIMNGQYRETITFTNIEDYNWFLENVKLKLEMGQNIDKKELYYDAPIILKEEGQPANIFTDKYIEYLNRSGFTCEEVKQ